MTATVLPAGASPALAGLDPEQQAAVLAPRGPVCILAGAGTGKTRTITHRIAHRVHVGTAPAGSVLAVTFTARAAGELRSRLRDLGAGGVQARTFHAAALRQLSYFWPRVIGGSMPELVQDKYRLIAGAAARAGLRPSPAEVRDLVSEVEWARATLQTPATYAAASSAARREPPFPADAVATVLTAYDEAKQRQGVVDFDDLLLLTAAAIEEHRAVADEVRGRYRSFVVDEYQDVTPLQQRLLDAWLGGSDDLTVVGDAQQTIYSFTGASPDPLLRFGLRFPEATVVRLVRDYRSTPQVVTLANAVLDRAPQGTATAAARLELRAQRPAGPPPVFAEHDDEPAEAASVVNAIRGLLRRGTPAAEVAVLYRVNAQSAAYEAALASAGVPYLLRGGERFFDRKEIRESVLLLRGAARTVDADEPETLVPGVVATLRATGWDPDKAPAGSGAVRERWESVAALARLAEQVAGARPTATLRDFVAELEDRAADQAAPTVDGVTLSTLHAAKGLEWDAVFLVGLVDGTLPLVHAETPAQVEEERRLLYVGVTRAREHLTLSWSLARSAGGRKSRRPSRFLDGLLPPSLARAAATRTSPRKDGACRGCSGPMTGDSTLLGRCADCSAGVDVELFGRLRSWRAERAKALAQPAYCVFTDATLIALAEARPGSAGELVAVQGIGQSKVDKFGAEVLAVVAGETPVLPG